MAEVTAAAQEVEEFELEALERAAAQQAQQWVARILGELEEPSAHELERAAQVAKQGSEVLHALERSLAIVDRVRQTMG
jgi:hypothetical protein